MAKSESYPQMQALVEEAEYLAGQMSQFRPDRRVGVRDSRDDHTLAAILAGFISGRSLAMLPGGGPDDSDSHFLAASVGCEQMLHEGGAIRVRSGSGSNNVDRWVDPQYGLGDGDSAEVVVLFTSGTTRAPRGVRLSARNLTTNLNSMHQVASPWLPSDVLGHTLSMSHSFGLSMALLAIARGVQVVFLPDGAPSQSLVLRSQQERVSLYACVPYFLRLMRRRSMSLGVDVAPELRSLFLAGGAMRDEDIDLLLPSYSGELYLMYGFTEATARVAVRLFGDGAPSGSVGLPLPGTFVDTVDSSGVPLPVGSEGLLRAHSNSLMIGYVGESPRRSGVPFVTTDFGYTDDAGNVFMTGRQAEMLNFRGNRVSLVLVEASIGRIDGILEAQLVPDSRAEDAQCLLRIVTSPGADVSAVRRRILIEVEPRGLIRSVEVVSALETTRSGKPLRRVGRER